MTTSPLKPLADLAVKPATKDANRYARRVRAAIRDYLTQTDSSETTTLALTGALTKITVNRSVEENSKTLSRVVLVTHLEAIAGHVYTPVPEGAKAPDFDIDTGYVSTMSDEIGRTLACRQAMLASSLDTEGIDRCIANFRRAAIAEIEKFGALAVYNDLNHVVGFARLQSEDDALGFVFGDAEGYIDEETRTAALKFINDNA